MTATTPKPRARSRGLLDAHYRHEHATLGLKPWEYAPCSVNDGPCPAWCDPDCWAKAQALRRAILAADPNHYRRYPPTEATP